MLNAFSDLFGIAVQEIGDGGTTCVSDCIYDKDLSTVSQLLRQNWSELEKKKFRKMMQSGTPHNSRSKQQPTLSSGIVADEAEKSCQ